MKLVNLSEVEPGTVVAYTLLGQDGRMLLKEGAALSERIVTKLQQEGYDRLFVQAEDCPTVPLEAPLSIEAQQASLAAVNDAFQVGAAKMPPGSRGDQASVQRVITRMVDALATNRDLNLQVCQLRSRSNYLFGHSMNVALLGIYLGRRLGGINASALVDLGMGLLLHDIGKVKLGDGMLPPGVTGCPRANRNPPKNAQAEEQLRTHPREGFELLQADWASVKAYTKIVALQHHERFDGTGYPKGLKGKEIHLFARICAVADCYDNLTAIAPEKEHLTPAQALEQIRADSGKAFDPEVVAAFMELVFPYPVGCRVVLTSGERAVVKQLRREAPLSPVVSLLTDRMGSPLSAPRDLDLRAMPTVAIKGDAV